MGTKRSPSLLLTAVLIAGAAVLFAAEEPEGGAAPVAAALKVIDSGAEPRMPVRYSLKPGLRQTVEMVIAVSGTFTTKMGAQEFTFPPVKLTLLLETRKAAGGEGLTFAFQVTAAEAMDDPAATPGLLDTTRDTAKRAVGLTGSGIVSDRGIVTGLEITHPEGLGRDSLGLIDILKQQFHQFMVPLPEVPLGIGARWTVTAPAKAAGFSFTNATTYRLTLLDDGQGRVEVSTSNTAEEQAVNLPMLPGLPARLKSLDSEGSGAAAFHLSRPVAESEVDMRLSMDLFLGDAEQEMPANADLKIRVAVTPTAASEATPK